MLVSRKEVEGMIIKVHLSIGYPTADCEDEIEIPDEELKGLSPEAKENLCIEYLQDWANNYIETWYEEI